MDYVHTTIYYNGQFWKALVEKGRAAGGCLPSTPSALNLPQVICRISISISLKISLSRCRGLIGKTAEGAAFRCSEGGGEDCPARTRRSKKRRK